MSGSRDKGQETGDKAFDRAAKLAERLRKIADALEHDLPQKKTRRRAAAFAYRLGSDLSRLNLRLGVIALDLDPDE